MGKIQNQMTERGFFFPEELPFYLDNSSFEPEIAELKSLGCKFIDVKKANQFGHGRLFDSLISHQGEKFPLYSALPLINHDELLTLLPFPYDIVEHDERYIKSVPIYRVIETIINTNFSDKKYLFCTDPGNGLAMEFSEFSYDIIWGITTGHLNDPFILFDENMDQSFLFDFDLCITIYTAKKDKMPDSMCGFTQSEILEFFNENFVDGVVKGNQYHLNVINSNYVPRLPGVSEFSFG